MSQINIITAQNVLLKIDIANIGDRFLACIVDFLIKFGITLIAGIVVTYANYSGVKIMIGLLMIITWGFYSLIFELTMGGQTPGKRSRNIRVAMLDGSALSFGALLLRWVLRIGDFFMFVGIWLIVGSDKHQRLGDIAAGTVLVSTKERTKLSDTLYNEIEAGYKPTYMEAERLSVREAEIIEDVLLLYKQSDKYELITLAAEKVKTHLQIYSTSDDLTFLKTLLKDYNHFSTNEVNQAESKEDFSVSI